MSASPRYANEYFDDAPKPACGGLGGCCGSCCTAVVEHCGERAPVAPAERRPLLAWCRGCCSSLLGLCGALPGAARAACGRSLTSRYTAANVVYCAYAFAIIYVDLVAQPRVNALLEPKPKDRDKAAVAAAYVALYDLYKAAAWLHLLNALQYVWAWLPNGFGLLSVVQLPEYLNVAGAALYLKTAYEYELVGGNFDPETLQVHYYETAASAIEFAAALGWTATWWCTFPRGTVGRGWTLDDFDLWGNLFIFVPSCREYARRTRRRRRPSPSSPASPALTNPPPPHFFYWNATRSLPRVQRRHPPRPGRVLYEHALRRRQRPVRGRRRRLRALLAARRRLARLARDGRQLRGRARRDAPDPDPGPAQPRARRRRRRGRREAPLRARLRRARVDLRCHRAARRGVQAARNAGQAHLAARARARGRKCVLVAARGPQRPAATLRRVAKSGARRRFEAQQLGRGMWPRRGGGHLCALSCRRWRAPLRQRRPRAVRLAPGLEDIMFSFNALEWLGCPSRLRRAGTLRRLCP